MRLAEIDTEDIGTWFPSGMGWNLKRVKSLARLVKKQGWKNIPRVPVYELPKEIATYHKYLLADGHKRRYVAENLEILLPCAIYYPDEIIDPSKDRIDSFDENYIEALALYKDPSIAKRWIEKRKELKWQGVYFKQPIF